MAEKQKPWQYVKSTKKSPKHVKMAPYKRTKVGTK